MKKLIAEIIIIILVFVLGMLTQAARTLRQQEVNLAKAYGANQVINEPVIKEIPTPKPKEIQHHTKTCPFKCPYVH